MRFVALDKSFSGVGLERGRLPHLYKVGSDTGPIVLLLLHAVSKLSLDGLGCATLPNFVTVEAKANLYNDLVVLLKNCTIMLPIGGNSFQNVQKTDLPA